MSDPTALLLLAYATCSVDSTADRVVPARDRYFERQSHRLTPKLRVSSGACISPPEMMATAPETLPTTKIQPVQAPDSLQEIFANLPLPTVPIPPTLNFGSIGPSVEKLQTQLQSLGYYTGSIDGQYGRLTRRAVSQFQQERKIPRNGIANSATWMELAKLSTSSRAAVPSQTFIAPQKPAPMPQSQVPQPLTERQIHLASLLGVVALLCGGMGTFVLLKLAQEQSRWQSSLAESEERDRNTLSIAPKFNGEDMNSLTPGNYD
jgi:hypothetical protein